MPVRQLMFTLLCCIALLGVKISSGQSNIGFGANDMDLQKFLEKKLTGQRFSDTAIRLYTLAGLIFNASGDLDSIQILHSERLAFTNYLTKILWETSFLWDKAKTSNQLLLIPVELIYIDHNKTLSLPPPSLINPPDYFMLFRNTKKLARTITMYRPVVVISYFGTPHYN